MAKKTVKPELIGGFRDMLPADALIFQEMTDKVKAVYKSFGFVPLETPCIENKDVLTGGDENFNKSIFVAKIIRGAEDKDVTDAEWDQDYALRFDLTVSLARVVAAYPDLPRPFKRYQLGKVWRGERPQAGRYREFFQLDFDTIGSNSILSDVEVIQVMYATMKALGVENFTIRFNTRKVLNGLAEAIGYSDKSKEVLRIIDKFDKIGFDGIRKELQRQPDNQYDETALAMSDEKVAKVVEFLEIKSDDSLELVAKLEQFFAGQEGSGPDGAEELKRMSQALIKMGIPTKNWRVDLSVARGLDYYTGPVFETYLDDLPEIGSVFSGGRFDGLTNRFIPDSNIAGVGASVGIDRLIVGMQKLGLLQSRESMTQVLVTIFDPSLQDISLQMANELRNAGFDTELYLGDDRTLRAQFAYAAKKAIPYAVVIGTEEAANNTFALKDMNARKQEVLTKDELFAKLGSVLN